MRPPPLCEKSGSRLVSLSSLAARALTRDASAQTCTTQDGLAKGKHHESIQHNRKRAIGKIQGELSQLDSLDSCPLQFCKKRSMMGSHCTVNTKGGGDLTVLQRWTQEWTPNRHSKDRQTPAWKKKGSGSRIVPRLQQPDKVETTKFPTHTYGSPCGLLRRRRKQEGVLLMDVVQQLGDL